MLIGLKQINHYLKHSVTADELVEILSRTEIEVEEVHEPVKYDKGLIVAETLTVEKHPNADRLKIVTVNIGNDTQLEIVCGAPNVDKNQRVVLATVGTVLQDGTKITKSSIRGIESNGMLCSEKELGLSDNHDGIYLLEPEITPGLLLCDIVNNDNIVDIKTPPNRWDFLSLWGVARQIAAFDKREGGNTVKNPEIPGQTYKAIKNKYVKNREEASRFVSVKMRVNNRVKTPQWVVDNLQSSGMRSISPIVDFSNFVMLELGHPTHAYDAAKLVGDIILRPALSQEKITTLDGRERKLTAEDLVIADERGPVALAGVMGGLDSEVSGQTTEVVLEIATFEATKVRRSALRHGLRSDASARFERSLPPTLTELAANRLIGLISEYCNGELVSPIFDDYPNQQRHVQIGFSQRRAEKLIGLSLEERVFSSGLEKLGFKVEHFSLTKATDQVQQERSYDRPIDFLNTIFEQIGDTIDDNFVRPGSYQQVDSDQLRAGDVIYHMTGKNLKLAGIVLSKQKVVSAEVAKDKVKLTQYSIQELIHARDYSGAVRVRQSFNHVFSVTPPWWRTDVKIEEDIVEEVAKLIGYDNIPMSLPDLPATETNSHSLLASIMNLKQVLVTKGLYEVMSYAFVSAKALESVGKKPNQHLEIHNPLTVEQQYLRSDLLASHLLAVAANQLAKEKLVFFETSHVYIPEHGKSLPQEKSVIGMMSIGEDSFIQIKPAVESIIRSLGLRSKYRPTQSAAGIKGRSYEVVIDNQEVGEIYQVKPSVLGEFGIKSEVSYALLRLDTLFANKTEVEAHDVPSYQLITRDINLVLPSQTSWQTISEAGSSQKQVFSIEFLSVFEDEELLKTHDKRFAMRVLLDLGATPTQEEIDAEVKKVAKSITKHIQN